MKKIATLLLAAGLVFGAATGASAIDFKAKGQWIMSFDYGQNGGFTGGNGMTGFNKANKSYKGEDEFEAKQRVRLQLDAVASESLSGTVFFEIGAQTWGQNDTGGALGADNADVVKLKNAYIDWMVPQTDLKVRMGIQGIALPSMTTGSNVFNDDVAGVVASYQFNENVGLTAFWARPWNDNFTGWNDTVHGDNYQSNYMDNVDVFALLLPLSFDGVKVTPWGMMAGIGPNAFAKQNGADRDYFNVSGTSDGVPAQQYADTVLELVPDAKNVAVLYCSAEPNSVLQADQFVACMDEKGVKTTVYTFTDSNDIQAVVTTAVEGADAMYIPTDNTAASNMTIISNVCGGVNLPVICGEEGMCGAGGLATVSISYYDIGHVCGEMAYDILVNGADVSTMPIGYAASPAKKYNPDYAATIGFEMPEGYEAIETE